MFYYFDKIKWISHNESKKLLNEWNLLISNIYHMGNMQSSCMYI